MCFGPHIKGRRLHAARGPQVEYGWLKVNKIIKFVFSIVQHFGKTHLRVYGVLPSNVANVGPLKRIRQSTQNLMSYLTKQHPLLGFPKLQYYSMVMVLYSEVRVVAANRSRWPGFTVR